ncbi:MULTISPECIES: hypothetical protein [unclassified Streptomyces]|uniref:hypothetical protein n=1 Tax=unclassified Streptomyces TaxID=2593676 RepID=UPI00081EDE3F|nr:MULTISPECIES: hypothetical protein [unclassified Streptomyces]MYZ34134.1 hypothetical protein [Streptomyces sp. SID4917]SCF64408.1 hypothetical protein GA0115259_100562 [Streptomyces sp. MnatMP-M17]
MPPRPPPAGPGAGPVPPPAASADQQSPHQPQPQPPEDGERAEEEHAQEARAAQRELFAHAPEFMLRSTAFGGSYVAGAQHGVSGGQVGRDVIMGSKTEIHHHGPSWLGPENPSGEISRAELDRLAEVFVEGDKEFFEAALRRLRTERVLVLSGAHSTGRRAAAWMLLYRLGVTTVRDLDPETHPKSLAAGLADAGGHVLCDLSLSRNRPLRDIHVRAVREQLAKRDSYLVITVRDRSYVHAVTTCAWQAPASADVLRAHLTRRMAAAVDTDTAGTTGAAHTTASDEVERLLGLPPVQDFLAQGHQRLAEVAAFAADLAAYDGSEQAREALAGFSRATVEQQCREWLTDTDLSLRDKAFLISLAVFDRAPYVLAAELGDLLFVRFQQLNHPEEPAEIPVFGPSVGDRLHLARARGEQRDEQTEWGQVPQYMAEFRESRTARTLLSDVWTAHPSARPALVEWLKDLARDGRPLVRTRAAATTALLAEADLPSTVALLIDGWATSRGLGARLMAANALTLAHLTGAPAVPKLLSQWCADAHGARRWTAIRAFALLAPVSPELVGPALDALAARAADEESGEAETEHLFQSTTLLLSAGRRAEMLSELVRLVQRDSPAVRTLALTAFTRSCATVDEDSLLEWYADNGAAEPDGRRDLATLWRTALGDLSHTRDALESLRAWVRAADRRPDVESALAALLPELIRTAADQQRLSHLLRTLRGADGGPPPGAAARLLAVLT